MDMCINMDNSIIALITVCITTILTVWAIVRN